MRDFKMIIVFIVLMAVALYVLWVWQAQRENERNLQAASETSIASGRDSAAVASPADVLPPKVYPPFSDEERVDLNTRLGLSENYPVEIVPLYGGMEVLELDSGDAESTDGSAMQRWLVRGQSVASQSDVADFYKDHMRKLKFVQTMTVSKPGEHGVDYGFNYADENYEIRYEIERRRDDTQTQIKLEVFKLVN